MEMNTLQKIYKIVVFFFFFLSTLGGKFAVLSVFIKKICLLFCFVAMHETSKRLSQTLKDVYESDWQGVGDLSVIMEVRCLCMHARVISVMNDIKVCVFPCVRVRTCCGTIMKRS